MTSQFGHANLPRTPDCGNVRELMFLATERTLIMAGFPCASTIGVSVSEAVKTNFCLETIVTTSLLSA